MAGNGEDIIQEQGGIQGDVKEWRNMQTCTSGNLKEIGDQKVSGDTCVRQVQLALLPLITKIIIQKLDLLGLSLSNIVKYYNDDVKHVNLTKKEKEI